MQIIAFTPKPRLVKMLLTPAAQDSVQVNEAAMTAPPTTGARIEIVGLSAAYGRTPVLDHVRLAVEPGGWLAVILVAALVWYFAFRK